MDLSFFIWDKRPSKGCVSEALDIYEQAISNHEALMKAVMEACRAHEGDKDEKRKAFRGKMKEIVLAHRLCTWVWYTLVLYLCLACSGEFQGWDGQGIRQMLREGRVCQRIGVWDLYVMTMAKGYEPDNNVMRPRRRCHQGRPSASALVPCFGHQDFDCV